MQEDDAAKLRQKYTAGPKNASDDPQPAYDLSQKRSLSQLPVVKNLIASSSWLPWTVRLKCGEREGQLLGGTNLDTDEASPMWGSGTLGGSGDEHGLAGRAEGTKGQGLQDTCQQWGLALYALCPETPFLLLRPPSCLLFACRRSSVCCARARTACGGRAPPATRMTPSATPGAA